MSRFQPSDFSQATLHLITEMPAPIGDYTGIQCDDDLPLFRLTFLLLGATIDGTRRVLSLNAANCTSSALAQL